MRKFGLSLLLCSMAAVPGAALSQEASSPDEYLCALTGECAEEAQESAEPAEPSGNPRVSATRSFSL